MLGMNIYELVGFIIGLVLSIAIHESAHAFALHLFGDHSYQITKRLTLRPNVHFKWWGYLILLFTGFVIGNPVIIEEDELDPKHNFNLVLLITKLAGPFSNLLTTISILFIMKYIQGYPNIYDVDYEIMLDLLESFAFINIFVFVFNMIPLPILDGGVVFAILIIKLELEESLPIIIFEYGSCLALIIAFNFFPNSSIVELFVTIPSAIMDCFLSLILGY